MSAISCTQRLSTVARRSTSAAEHKRKPWQTSLSDRTRRPGQRGAAPRAATAPLTSASCVARAPCLLPRARQASRAPCLERALRCAPAHAARPRSCSRSRHSPSAPQRACAPLRAAARSKPHCSCSALAPAPAPPQRCAVASFSRLIPRRYSVSTALDAAQCAAEDNEGFALALEPSCSQIYLSFLSPPRSFET